MSKIRAKKIALGVTSILLTASVMLSGCGEKKNKVDINSLGDVTLPLKEKTTLSYWVGLGGSVGLVNDYGELPMYKELEKQTNVHIDFIHPISGSVKEQFNVMVASGEYPDIIEGVDGIYNGGAVKAYEDEIILSLNDLQEKYAPNLTAIYEENPSLIPHATDEKGRYFSVPVFRGGLLLRIPGGLYIRQDWLDEVGMEMPETIDELTEVLRAFKKEKGAAVPITIDKNTAKNDFFAGVFGIRAKTPNAYSVENGKVIYGPADKRYKDYLTLLNTWYKEGLIESEFAIKDSNEIRANILSEKSGVFSGGLSATATYMDAMSGKNPDVDIQPMPFPSLKKGGVNSVIALSDVVNPSSGAYITTACKNPHIAMAWLDYMFTKEGNLACNFGAEGTSYTMVDGKPVYTELITKNPDGLSMAEIGRKTCRGFAMGPFIQDMEYGKQFFALPIQQKTAEVWGETFEKQTEDSVLRGTLTSDEAARIATLQADITTFVDECFLKFVMGVKPLSEFDDYIAQLKKMGVGELIKIKQNAYDRFIKRNPDYIVPSDLELSARFYE